MCCNCRRFTDTELLKDAREAMEAAVAAAAPVHSDLHEKAKQVLLQMESLDPQLAVAGHRNVWVVCLGCRQL